MSGGAPPLRFLILVVGGWVCIRGAVLASGWWLAQGEAATKMVQVAGEADAAYWEPVPGLGPASTTHAVAGQKFWPQIRTRRSVRSRLAAVTEARPSANEMRPPRSEPAAPLATATPPLAQMPSALAAPARQGRWSGSAWLLLRRERSGEALAPGGTLGGSQAGARILYRLNDDPARALSLSGRLYAPLRDADGAEAALGIDWHPVAALPVHLLVERRQKLGDEGRSAFSLTLYGGRSFALARDLRLDTYVQTGAVGLKRRDLFVDGAAQLRRRIGPVELGAAAWGAAQPGAARLDVGPELSFPLLAGNSRLRLSADWRFRVAGDAAPESGPALTLGADF